MSSEPDSVHSRIQKLRETTMSRMRDLRQYLSGDPMIARAYLAKHVEKIEMEPSGRA